MKSQRIAILVVTAFGLIGLINGIFGCSSSNTANGTGTVAGSLALTNCTTSTNGTPETCIPTLGNYGTEVTFQGQITNITQTNGQCNGPCAGATLLHDYFGPNANVPSYAEIANSSSLLVDITETSQGPSITMILQIFGIQIEGNNLSGYGEPGLGFTQFFPSTPNSSSGIMELDPYLISGTSPVDVNSLTQPWDGSFPLLTGLTVTIGGAYFGTVNLNF